MLSLVSAHESSIYHATTYLSIGRIL
jgi:hypothetical protein